MIYFDKLWCTRYTVVPCSCALLQHDSSSTIYFEMLSRTRDTILPCSCALLQYDSSSILIFKCLVSKGTLLTLFHVQFFNMVLHARFIPTSFDAQSTLFSHVPVLFFDMVGQVWFIFEMFSLTRDTVVQFSCAILQHGSSSIVYSEMFYHTTIIHPECRRFFQAKYHMSNIFSSKVTISASHGLPPRNRHLDSNTAGLHMAAILTLT